MHNMKNIGTAVRKLRKQMGVTLEDLANRVDYDQGNLSKFERGLQTPADTMVDRIAKELGVTKATLLRMAAELEENEGLPPSTATVTSSYAAEPIKQYQGVREVPVYQGEHVKALAEDHADVEKIAITSYVPAPQTAERGDFAMLISDDTMTAPPGAAVSYPKGSHAYFARGLEHRSGDAALVVVGGSQVITFTSLQVINGRWHMVPLNPRYQPSELPFDSKIVAVAYGVFAVTRNRQ